MTSSTTNCSSTTQAANNTKNQLTKQSSITDNTASPASLNHINNNSKLIDDLDSLRIEATSMTSSYSNKTSELIHRTQHFLEKTNLAANKPTAGSNLNSNNHESINNNSNMTFISPLTTNTASGSSSGGHTNGLDNNDFISNKSNFTSINYSNSNTGAVNGTPGYGDLLKELNRYKEQDLVQRQQIDELKANQEQF
jgi:hypothetical protein